MEYVNIAVSAENPKYSCCKLLGNVEKDIDAMLHIALKEGTCE
jgi:hypothetical protein